ncbi:MAG TPA: SDR family oxidoreductase [Magnetospirillaceae bacterium]|jgi:NAD(P)-dependent dehydrogenase (short-subunit alcohol dehydrogenase family)
MQGKTVVITGATSGIGLVAAERLAGMGARLVLVARDQARGDKAMAKIRSANPAAPHAIHYGDLSIIAEMKRLAAAVAAAEPKIDVLINNAGALFNPRRETADGLEVTFATNHMAYFVFTHGLRERLLATPGARVVNTASDAHKGQRLDFDDLQAKHGYSAFKVYGRSKLANILFTREAARKLANTGVTVNCLHPGFVATRFGDNSQGPIKYLIGAAKQIVAISPLKGSETIVHLAASPDVTQASGGYYYKSKLALPTTEAQSVDSARRLWSESEKLADVSW